MELKSVIMDEAAVHRTMARITHEIIERNKGLDNLILLGVKRRGIPLAHLLAENMLRFEGVRVPVGELDITLYRDDLKAGIEIPSNEEKTIPFDVAGKKIIVVDDVIYTGRTARAAIEAVFDRGRPREIQLAVLIDRGHRELPIRADYVGKNIPTSRTEMISVQMDEIDGQTKVELFSM